jgi:hypothetical protein
VFGKIADSGVVMQVDGEFLRAKVEKLNLCATQFATNAKWRKVFDGLARNFVFFLAMICSHNSRRVTVENHVAIRYMQYINLQ